MASAITSPIRLDSTLLEAARREGSINKRTAPKQIEFWAELGRAVEPVLDFTDVFAVIQGFKKIKVETVESIPADPVDVFNSLEESRKSGELAQNVTSSTVYFEASQKIPGLIDRVNSSTGKRQTGRFHNGEFKVKE
jgi:hypothetical protein